MLSNRLAFLALAIACIGAAAGGGYLASRQNAVPAPASAQGQMAAAPVATSVTAALPATASVPTSTTPVQETEAVVGDTAAHTPASAGSASRTATETPAARRGGPPPRPARESRPVAARQDPTPTLTNSWPSGAAQQPPVLAPASAPVPADNPAPARPEERAIQEARAPEPPQKAFEELVVPADSVIGLQTDTRLSSDTARVEDRVDARVTRDVKVGGRVAIPAGSQAVGTVTQVDRGGKFKERARLGIRFNSLVLADGTRLSINTETIYRDGELPGNRSAAKVGGAAVGGAILGAILGGAKGAAIGATAGAGGGTAAVMAGDRSPATLAAGTPMTVRILAPVTVTAEKN